MGLHRVVLVGVDHHVVLLAAAVQGAGHLDGVLEVDVVVGRTVANQELAMQVSLLNNDYEKIIKELEKLEKEK